MARIYTSADQLIGHTPLLELGRIAALRKTMSAMICMRSFHLKEGLGQKDCNSLIHK